MNHLKVLVTSSWFEADYFNFGTSTALQIKMQSETSGSNQKLMLYFCNTCMPAPNHKFPQTDFVVCLGKCVVWSRCAAVPLFIRADIYCDILTPCYSLSTLCLTIDEILFVLSAGYLCIDELSSLYDKDVNVYQGSCGFLSRKIP